jgi:alpha-glucosidase (family GH31 glycosyl hydrolase)
MRTFGLLCLLAACRAPDDRPADDTAPTAPAPPWPAWAFTHWVWEDESTAESATALVDGYLSRDIPVGAVIIDSPWATGYSTFVWDETRFPDPQGFVDDMHARDVKVFVWTVPGINVDVQPLYDEAAAAGYFMRASAEATEPAVVEWWKGDGSLIDYFNPDAVAWWHEQVDQTLALGIDGWKCDGLDFSALLAPYSPGAGRNVDRLEYSHAYYRDFHDYTRAELGDDRMNTARPIDNYGLDLGGDVAAFAPVDINWAGWVGDQDGSFDGLRAALLNMYYSAEYGYVAFGSDIGGYRDEADIPFGRTQEVFTRWAQQGAFAPVMESLHTPWSWGDETVATYRELVRLHTALIPYLDREGAIAFAEGRSLMVFQSKERFDYLLGPDLYVAPLLDEGTDQSFHPPAGDDWLYLYDPSVVVVGGEIATLPVPLHEAPVLVREGSELLPLLRAELE